MADQRITADRVNEAATTLKADGKDVTYTAVREQLGGGSMRDIAVHLKAWRATQESAKRKITIPEELHKALQAFYDIQSAADKDDTAATIAEIQRESDDLSAEVDRLEEALGKAEKKAIDDADEIKRLRDVETVSRGEVNQLNTQVEKLNEKLEEKQNQLNRQASEHASAMTQAKADADKVLKDVQKERDQLKKQIEQLETDFANAQKQLAELTTLQDEVKNLRPAYASLERENTRLSSEVENLKKSLEDVKNNARSDIKEAKEQAKADLQEAKEQAAKDRKELTDLQTTLRELTEKEATARTGLVSAKEKIEDLKAQLEAVTKKEDNDQKPENKKNGK